MSRATIVSGELSITNGRFGKLAKGVVHVLVLGMKDRGEIVVVLCTLGF